MVNIVHFKGKIFAVFFLDFFSGVQRQEIFDGYNHIFRRERAAVVRWFLEFFEFEFADQIKHIRKLFVDFVAAHETQIVAADIIKH